MATRKTTPTESTQVIDLTPEEVQAIIAARERLATLPSDAPAKEEPKVAVSELAQALVTAIEATRPPAKKNPFNRKKGDPWQPKDGSPKPKLKRAWFQHGGEMDEKQLYPEEIELLNQAKPGVYCKGLVRITRRTDRGYDITWSAKTSAHRLRVINEAGASLAAILKRCIDEHNNPAKFRGPEDDED